MTPGSMSSSSPLRAFSFSGRFSVIVAMPSEMSSRMMSDVVVISGLLVEPAPIIWQRERLEKAALGTNAEPVALSGSAAASVTLTAVVALCAQQIAS